MKKFFKKKEKLEDIKERITNLSYNKDEDYGILPPPISNGTFVNGEKVAAFQETILVEIEYKYRNIKK